MQSRHVGTWLTPSGTWLTPSPARWLQAIAGGAPIELKLFAKVQLDECSWSLSDGCLVATLEKAIEGETWPALTA